MNIGKAIKEIRERKGIEESEYFLELEMQKEISTDKLKEISKKLDVPESYITFKSLDKEEIKEERQPLYDALIKVFDDLIIQ